MGHYGRDNITKYFSIGFTEEELQEIDEAYKRHKGTDVETHYFNKRTRFIRHLAMSSIDLEKENQQLKSVIREARAQAVGQSGASEETAWSGYFRNVKRDGNILHPVWG